MAGSNEHDGTSMEKDAMDVHMLKYIKYLVVYL